MGSPNPGHYCLMKSHEKNVISIRITMVTMHFLMKLHEIRTLQMAGHGLNTLLHYIINYYK